MRPFVAATLTAGMLSAWTLSDARDGSQAQTPRITGAWRMVEVTRKDPTGRRNRERAQPGLYLFTNRHYSMTRVEASKPRPDLPRDRVRTSDHYRDTWGPFAAQAGTYELRAGNLTTRPQVAKNPSRMQRRSFSTYRVRLTADTLWLQLITNDSGAVPDSIVHKLVRAER